MRRLFLFVVVGSLLSGCGALKKTKKIDRVKQSAEVEVKLEARSDSNVKVENKSVKEEKVSEKYSDDAVTVTEIFFDDKGNINYIVEKKTESRKRDSEKETRDSLDRKEDSNTSAKVKLEGKVENKVDSLKSDTDINRPENSIYKYIGIGLLIVFAAVALVLFIRFRK